MAVQAQYPCPAFRVHNSVFEEFQQHIFNGTTVFSEPGSELTCNNLCGSRKRNRDMLHQEQLRFSKFPRTQIGETQLNISEATSTSGRSSGNSPFLVTSNAHDLQSQLLYHGREMDALILMENEKLRLGLAEAQKIHCRSLLSIIELQAVKRLEEKEIELANARQRNAELGEKVKQMIEENQIWFSVAKNNEATVYTLKSSLEQILLQNQGQSREGFGDSGSIADDAQSCSSSYMPSEKTIRENQELKGKKYCKVCQENELSVLVLPCRHLSLCKNCDSKVDSCPICSSWKITSLPIFTS